MDVIKERMQIQKDLKHHHSVTNNPTNNPNKPIATNTKISDNIRYKNVFDCFQKTVRRDGFKSLYRGFILHQCMWGPFNAIFFPLYQGSKTKLTSMGVSDLAHPLCALTSAMVSALFLSLFLSLSLSLTTDLYTYIKGFIYTIH